MVVFSEDFKDKGFDLRGGVSPQGLFFLQVGREIGLLFMGMSRSLKREKVTSAARCLGITP